MDEDFSLGCQIVSTGSLSLDVTSSPTASESHEAEGTRNFRVQELSPRDIGSIFYKWSWILGNNR